MLETAENLRRDYQITRAEQDAFALRSHQQAVAAQKSGAFDSEIIAVTVPGKKGDTVVTKRRASACRCVDGDLGETESGAPETGCRLNRHGGQCLGAE